jgi:hypothetical protein
VSREEDIAYVERVRKLVADYDEGKMVPAEVGGILFRDAIEQVVEVLKLGEAFEIGGSWCGSEPPPPTVVRAFIKIGAASIRITPFMAWRCNECHQRYKRRVHGGILSPSITGGSRKPTEDPTCPKCGGKITFAPEGEV